LCGILGGPESRGNPKGALDLLAWRGPDQGRLLRMGSFLLGCRRLSITDPRASQPRVIGEAGTRIACGFNGNLGDQEELRRRLALAGVFPETRSDADLCLLLYACFGPGGLETLSGQFAFAIYDEARARLVLGRDPFGEKPLFVREGAGFPSFASTPPSLRRFLGGGLGEPDPGALSFFLRFGAPPPEGDPLGLGGEVFPKGRIRIYGERGRIGEREVRPAATPPELGGAGFEEGTALLIRRLVRGRTEGDRSLGLFLSGGIDSSLLALELVEAGKRPFCLAGDFRGGRSEGMRASEVARRLGLPLRRVEIDEGCLARLPDLVVRAGFPLGDASILALDALCRAAAAEGVGIAFSGDGGDELFFGYRRQRAFDWAERFRNLLPEAWAFPFRKARGAGPRGRLLRALAASEGESYAELLATADPREVGSLLGRKGDVPAGAAICRSLRVFEGDEEGPRRADLEFYLPADLCPKLDIATLSHGIEGRAPFLDLRLRERMRGRRRPAGEVRGKALLRALLSRRLPSALRGGAKRGFGPPLARWLRESPLPAAWLGDPALKRRAPWRPGAALELLRRLERGRDDLAPLVFSLCALSVHWLEREKEAARA